MNRGGWSLPLVTDRNEPMPSSSISLRSSTVALMSGNSCASASARSPRYVGVQTLPGQVAEVAGQVHAVRDREAARRGGFARREVGALRHRKRELAQRPPHFGLFAFHLVEAVDRLHRDDDGVLDPPGDLAPLDLFLGDVDDGLVGAGLVQAA